MPVLEELAAEGGAGISAERLRAASLRRRPADLLFGGGGFSSQPFTDLFNGTDAEGRGYRGLRGLPAAPAGKNTYVVFSGQIYAIQRRPGAQGHTAIVPDREAAQLLEAGRATWSGSGSRATRRSRRSSKSIPPTRWRRASCCSTRAFRAPPARAEEGGPGAASMLGPDEALVAATGKDRFEPGCMLRSRAGRRAGAPDVRRRLRLAGAAQGAQGEAGVRPVASGRGSTGTMRKTNFGY